MANDVKSKVILGIDVNEFRRGITQVDSSIKGISRQFQNLGGVIGASFAVGQIQQFAKEAINLNGQLQKAAAGFARFGTEADLEMMRKQTRGLVTDLELMQQTVKGANLGIPFRDMGVLLEFAKRRADETGESIENLIGSIIEGVGRKSTRRLDNLGISADRLKEKVGGISLEMASVADVSRAMVDIASEELAKMGPPIDTAADKIQRMTVAWENFKAAIGGPIAGELANFLEKLSLTVLPGEQGGGLAQGIRARTGNTGAVGKIKPRQEAPVMASPMAPSVEIVKTAEQLKAEQEAITRQYEKQWEIMQNQLALYAQMQTQVEETFKRELVEGFTQIQLEEIDMLEGEFIPILEEVKNNLDAATMVAMQFGDILKASFEASIVRGEDFFTTLKEGLKNYVQQMLVATAATTALAVALAFVTGGANFKAAFNAVGSGMGLPFGFGEGGKLGLQLAGNDFYGGMQRNTNRNARIGG